MNKPSKITYTENKGAPRPTYTTAKYGNLFADPISGEVEQDGDGEWSAWVWHYNVKPNLFKFGFASRGAAAKWVNDHLREAGVR